MTRVAREVGTEGKLGGQAMVRGVGGTWKDLTDNVNSMATNLTDQVRNIAEVTTAVANGDLSKKITVDVKGEILELKNTINTMVDQLNSFASEVTRVAREVGTEGKLGGQAMVKGGAGTWKDLTDNVNSMAANLTIQVRGIAKVVTSVANGDLERKLVLEAKGEIAELADTINGMIDTLAIFADQVTTVASEVGIEGKLGGQARVPGAAGLWRALTDNVNRLAANLTTQVRAIAEVATAVTKGDLTRSISVEAQGEVAALKDNINEMIRNLKGTTRKSTEQDWLKSNLATFTRMLQGHRALPTVSKLLLSELAPLVNAQHGVFYVAETDGDSHDLRLLAAYAYKTRKAVSNRFKFGEGLVGQCAVEKERIFVTRVPPDYIQISSGLGEATPTSLVVLPVLFEGEVRAVIELASFEQFTEVHLAFLEQLTESIGIVLNTISATTRTEELLEQSQALTAELQSQQQDLTESNKRLEQQAKVLQQSEELLKMQQDELQKANLELHERAHLLSEQKAEVERKNIEVEEAKQALEEKAVQLALTSKYKSEFLANMSHELRTPLNSLLILSSALSENGDGNLTEKQLEFIRTIHSSGSDLFALINEILDLSKIEAGAMGVDIGEHRFVELCDGVERTFRQVAESKGTEFKVELDPALPATLCTDERRLQQVLKNLLSNAFKFTEKGRVSLKIGMATKGWRPEHEVLAAAKGVVAFTVSDTGIGISKDKQKIIFEAFQQADGTTSRRYGGTGLGLSISREIARLLGGEIHLDSELGRGSTFTLFLPLSFGAVGPMHASHHAGPLSARGGPRRAEAAGAHREQAPGEQPLEPVPIDDLAETHPGDRSFLIVEGDMSFAKVLLDLARERGFKGLIATRAERALALARELQPKAITLEVRLPDADGWTVLERLKHDLRTRHIPVQVISGDPEWKRGIERGAMAYLGKPADLAALRVAFDRIAELVDVRTRRLLIVDDDAGQRMSITELIGGDDVSTTAVESGEEALAALRTQRFDCVVTDLGLPDMSGVALAEAIRKDAAIKQVPLIVYTGREVSDERREELAQVAEAIVLKDVSSPELLFAETSLHLHRPASSLTEAKRRMLEMTLEADPLLAGKKVLIVDDDGRNIFALTTVLERKKIEVVHADSGAAALAVLASVSGIDAVLLDVMMPEMDGYETMQAIRQFEEFDSLPIIALTARAMKGDREKCIEAGASDYIAKPVDVEQLFTLLRVWLYR